jgi:surface protein
MTLHVTKGTPPNQVTYTESIPYASIGENAFALTNQQLIYDFDNKPPGTTYSYHITTNYTPGSFPTGDVITTPTVTNQTVKATPVIDIMSLTYNPAIEDHSILETVNSNSDGQISYTSSNPNVVSIEPGTGRIIAVEPGTAYLTITQSSTPEYEEAVRYEKVTVASGPGGSLVVSAEPAWLQLLNNVTIRDTGNPRVFQSNSPVFVEEDPRRRGTEWFAIVNNSSLPEISNYARTLQSQFFTPPGQSTPVPFDNIVTTHVTNMSFMFAGATMFDHDISSWDTSRVTNMSFMFQNATSFNQPLNNWDTSRVTDMGGMFRNAFNFNRPLLFNQSLDIWNTSRVINMSAMFAGARSFNQNISNWNTSNVRDMSSMFWGAINFNNGMPSWWMFPLLNPNNRLTWNVSNVIPSGFNFMFNGAFGFNTNISGWDVRNVNDNSPAVAFRRNSRLIDDFTPRAILNAPGRGQ